MNGTHHPYDYQGKENQEELGLNWHDFGWRNYDASLGRWMNLDPLAEKKYELTPYNYVQNSPMFRIDPDGLTDYTLNKKTGKVTQVGDTNDEPDRILKTNRKGKIKRYKRGKKKGEAKIAIDGIDQGILEDGQNLKENNTVVEVGGEGQPTENGVESFALKLSSYLGVEIGGSYFSKDEVDNITHISIGAYKNGEHKRTGSLGLNLRGFVSTVEEANRFTLRALFHTHPGNGRDISNSDRLVPSTPDVKSRDNALKVNPNLRFFLLTLPVNYGDKFPNKIDYTTGYSRRH